MNEKIENDLARENLVISNNFKRIKAYIIDDFLISFIVIIAFYDSITNESDILVVIEKINSAVTSIILLKVAYQAIFIYLYGATIGKMLAKITTISVSDLAKPSLNQAIIRAVVRIFSEMFFYFGFIWAFFNPLKQTWHDKVAKTVVIDV